MGTDYLPREDYPQRIKRLPGMWIGVSARPHDWQLLDQGYPMTWCVGSGCFVGDWIFMYLPRPQPYFGICYVYRVRSIHYSVSCANLGLDAADIQFAASIKIPITLQELQEHPDLRNLPAVVQGFHGTIFPVQNRRHKDALLTMAVGRAPILMNYLS